MDIKLIKDTTNDIYWGKADNVTALLIVPFKQGGQEPDILSARAVRPEDLQKLSTTKAVLGMADALSRLLSGERPL